MAVAGGTGVSVAIGVLVGKAVAVGTGVAVGNGVAVGSRVAVAVGAWVAVAAGIWVAIGAMAVGAGSLPQATVATVVTARAKIARSRRMGWASVNRCSTLGTPLQLRNRGFLPQSPRPGTH